MNDRHIPAFSYQDLITAHDETDCTDILAGFRAGGCRLLCRENIGDGTLSFHRGHWEQTAGEKLFVMPVFGSQDFGNLYGLTDITTCSFHAHTIAACFPKQHYVQKAMCKVRTLAHI